MTLPWEKVESSGPSVVDNVVEGWILAPRYKQTIDWSRINEGYRREDVRRHLGGLPGIVGAKVTNDQNAASMKEFEDFCEENICVRHTDRTETPSEWTLDRPLDLSIPDTRLIKNLNVHKVYELNAVQRRVVPLIREGRSVIVEAPTGIGKTYAFLIPIVERVLAEQAAGNGRNASKPSPYVLVLSSTGRLATQSYNRCNLVLGMREDDRVQPIFEVKIDRLVADHKFTNTECDIAFATMGKLKQMIEDDSLCLDNLRTIIIDEADKMVDCSSFGMDVQWLFEKLKEEVRASLQTCFFSATYLKQQDGEVSQTGVMLNMLADREYSYVHCPRKSGYIKQFVIQIPRPDFSLTNNTWLRKMIEIRKLIDADLAEQNTRKEGPYKQTMIIFCEQVTRVAQVTMALRQMGYNFYPMSRQVLKDQQEIYLNDLAHLRIHGVVSTNVLARGIDVPSIKHTVVMEMSTDLDTYKHRIGRVGRDGSGGKATVFIDSISMTCPRTANTVEMLVDYLMESEEEVPEWLKKWYNERQEMLHEYESQSQRYF
ncbi:unnamed protein product [Caenorhabditis sp. 36 PRJEB53466]|nr:unnamed protein product [Caenorhabditis sp. 36 PRJEB53466]